MRLMGARSLQDTILSIPGCVGLYMQNELAGTLARDLTNTNQGTYTSSPTLGRPPTTPYEVASVKHGSGSYVQLKSGPILGGLTSSSIVLSIQTATTGARYMYAERSTTGQDVWSFFTDTQPQIRRRNDAGTIWTFAGTATVTDGRPHVIGVSHTGNTFTHYKDGLVNGSTTTMPGDDTFTNANVSTRIAFDVMDGSAYSWQDRLGFVALFNRTLNSGEMRQIAATALGS